MEKLYWPLNLWFILIYKSCLLPSKRTFSELHSVCAGLSRVGYCCPRRHYSPPIYHIMWGRHKGPSPAPFIFKFENAENGLLRKQEVFWAASHLLKPYHLFNIIFTHKFYVHNTVRVALGLPKSCF